MQTQQVEAELKNAENQAISTENFRGDKLTIVNIKNTWLKIRPILKFVRGILFFKPKWQKIIDTSLTAIDAALQIEN